MYLCRNDIGQRDSAQFIFLLDQREILIALFAWPAVIVISTHTACGMPVSRIYSSVVDPDPDPVGSGTF